MKRKKPYQDYENVYDVAISIGELTARHSVFTALCGILTCGKESRIEELIGSSANSYRKYLQDQFAQQNLEPFLLAYCDAHGYVKRIDSGGERHFDNWQHEEKLKYVKAQRIEKSHKLIAATLMIEWFPVTEQFQKRFYYDLGQ